MNVSERDSGKAEPSEAVNKLRSLIGTLNALTEEMSGDVDKIAKIPTEMTSMTDAERAVHTKNTIKFKNSQDAAIQMQKDIIESLKASNLSINAGEGKAVLSDVNADQAIAAKASQEKKVECKENLSELLEEREMEPTAPCNVDVHDGESSGSK